MSNDKKRVDPWNLIGWGIIGVILFRILPFIALLLLCLVVDGGQIFILAAKIGLGICAGFFFLKWIDKFAPWDIK